MENKRKYNPCCKECQKPFDFSSFVTKEARVLKDLDHSSKGAYCSNCFNEAFVSLKESRFVEKYNGKNIYQKDGLYAPYWESSYAFDNIEDCKKRMDMKGVAVTPFGMM